MPSINCHCGPECDHYQKNGGGRNQSVGIYHYFLSIANILIVFLSWLLSSRFPNMTRHRLTNAEDPPEWLPRIGGGKVLNNNGWESELWPVLADDFLHADWPIIWYFSTLSTTSPSPPSGIWTASKQQYSLSKSWQIGQSSTAIRGKNPFNYTN